MTTRRPRDDPEWRAFEQLVARIEQDAGHTGVTVISPDRIRCRITGRLREVDASIRDAAGNLTTVECRQRRGRQDVTWIEQLATKRISLGATCTIAVSATGFSAAAHQIALAHGILLKEVRAIDEAELNPLMGLDLVHFSHKRAAIVSVGLRFATSTDWTVPNDGDLDMAMPEDVDLFAPIFRNVDEGHSWSINDIWHQLQVSADPFAGLAKGAAPVVRGACFPYPGNVTVETSSGIKRIGDVVLNVALWIEVEAVRRSDAERVEYASADGATLQRVEFASSEPGAADWRISLQIPKQACDPASLNIRSHWLTSTATPT